MRYAYLTLAFAVVLTVSYLGFKGRTFTQPPRDVFPEWAFPGMKYQPKLKSQGPFPFFADGRADRNPPEHVVASSYGPDGQPLQADDALYRGKGPDGQWLKGYPASLTINRAFLERGRDRFNIYCRPCHGTLGDGMGVTKYLGMGATPSYQIDRIMQMPNGQIFDTISHGFGNMQTYGDKLVPADRWAVVAYVRALQRAEHGTVADVPASHKSDLGIK